MTSTSASTAVSLRVYAGKALVSPGSLYKSVLLTPETTAHEVIANALERYGESVSAADFDLAYVLAPAGSTADSGVAAAAALALHGAPKAGGSVKIKNKKAHVLDPDENPLLVIEWFNEGNRRFELRRKEKESIAASPLAGGNGKEGLLSGLLRRASSIRSPRKDSSAPVRGSTLHVSSAAPVGVSAGVSASVGVHASAEPAAGSATPTPTIADVPPVVEMARILPEANLPTVRKASAAPQGSRVSYL